MESLGGVATCTFDRGLVFSNESPRSTVGIWKISGQDTRERGSDPLGSGFGGSPIKQEILDVVYAASRAMADVLVVTLY